MSFLGLRILETRLFWEIDAWLVVLGRESEQGGDG